MADYHTIMKKQEEAIKNGELRGPDGRFKKGGPGGPGNAAIIRDRVRYQSLLRDCVTDKDFIKVAKKLLEKAQDGESWAVAELLNRLMGKPRQVAEVDIKQTNVDPRQVVNNIALILGLSDDDKEEKQIEAK